MKFKFCSIGWFSLSLLCVAFAQAADNALDPAVRVLKDPNVTIDRTVCFGVCKLPEWTGFMRVGPAGSGGYTRLEEVNKRGANVEGVPVQFGVSKMQQFGFSYNPSSGKYMTQSGHEERRIRGSKFHSEDPYEAFAIRRVKGEGPGYEFTPMETVTSKKDNQIAYFQSPTIKQKEADGLTHYLENDLDMAKFKALAQDAKSQKTADAIMFKMYEKPELLGDLQQKIPVDPTKTRSIPLRAFVRTEKDEDGKSVKKLIIPMNLETFKPMTDPEDWAQALATGRSIDEVMGGAAPETKNIGKSRAEGETPFSAPPLAPSAQQ